GVVDGRQIAGFVVYDYIGFLCWSTTVAIVPLLIISHAGAKTNGYFNIAWVITYTLYLVSINIGSSLVVETAHDFSTLATATRRVLRHLARLLVPAVVITVAGAPLILHLFGGDYAARGTTTLRILALSALPYIVNSTAVSAFRARRRTSAVLS